VRVSLLMGCLGFSSRRLCAALTTTERGELRDLTDPRRQFVILALVELTRGQRQTSAPRAATQCDRDSAQPLVRLRYAAGIELSHFRRIESER
jgi:hypothetical protein